MKPSHLSAALAALLSAQLVYASEPQQKKFENSPKGFDKQYHQLVHDYWKAKEKDRSKILDEFSLTPGWFSTVFGGDHGPELIRQYAEQFQYFAYSTAQHLRVTSPCVGCVVEIKTSLTESVEISSPSTGLPPVQRFAVHCITKVYDDNMQSVLGGSDETWLDSFIYVDGVFRFYGKGASTFFDPSRVHLADPCSTNGKQTGGQLIQHTEPEYPEEAKAQHIQGTVSLFVSVSADGTVKDVKVRSGDPLLAEAAKRAVLQWRYAPFIQCGKAVEMTTTESIQFPPSAH